MTHTITLVAAFAVAFAAHAMADDKKIIVDPPGPAPLTVIVEQTPEVKSDATGKQPDIKPSPATVAVPTVPRSGGVTLTDQEAKSWIDKPVYSSDGKNIGEVVDFQRDAEKNVIGMHADIGGLFGFGQTRVNLTHAHYTLQSDRVVLDLTAAQAKELPKAQI